MTDFTALKLLKAPAKRDERNIRLGSILKTLPPLPDAYNCDQVYPFSIPLPMFGNDVYGDCVMAGRAHQTLRFEAFEQDKAINISDQDVEAEYFAETGGQDTGLVMLDSLNEWRSQGWQAAGERYNALGFAELDRSKHGEIMASIYLLRGAEIGLQLPLTAQDQIAGGEIWDMVPDDGSGNSDPGSWGGHCVYLVAYGPAGPICVTWGQLQAMTWAFFDVYCDEAYAVIQSREAFVANDPVDVALLQQEIAEITGQTPPAPTPPQPTPPAPPNPGPTPPPAPVPTPTKDEMVRVGNWLIEQAK